MLTKIARQNCLAEFKVFPVRGYNYEKDEETFFYPKVFKNFILLIPGKSFKGSVKGLGVEVVKLLNAFKFDELIFLGDTEIAWLYQSNDYKPAKEAQEYLIGKKIGKRFNGALQVDKSELPIFIAHLAWLTRCNASLPYFYFIDKGQNIVGNICKYGNLHLDLLNKQTNKDFLQFMKESEFEYNDDGGCDDRFSRTSSISGRQIII